eukprot:scaffold13886_cov110-Cylindrotheca_fusiformis.AAC.1
MKSLVSTTTTRATVVLLLLLLCCCGFIISTTKAQDDATISCFEALTESDANDNGRLSQEEFVNFVKASSPDGLFDSDEEEEDNSFDEFPLVIRSTFFAMSCSCPEEEDQ